jgi:broad specificity phosphatase PhoE
MSARIVLVRHGKSTHRHDGSWLRHDEVHRFENAYDAAGIRDDSHPSPELIAEAAAVDVVYASDMIRAIESAARLAPKERVVISPLLREITLEPPSWIPAKLPLDAWDMICQLRLRYRIAVMAEHAFVERAQRAVEMLSDHVGSSGTAVVVTHGGFRQHLAARFELAGWIAAGPNRSYANWSTWSFTRPIV